LAKNKTEKLQEDDILSTKEEIIFALDYAKRLSERTGLYPSVFNPVLLNSRLKDISLSSTGTKVNSDSVAKALENPKESEKTLLAMSESFEVSSTPYRRLLGYMSDLLSWDWTYSCMNIGDESNYKSTKYKKDLDIMSKFMDSFDHKSEFARVSKELYRTDSYFCVLRDEGEKYILQQLPPDYCLITGRWDYGLLFSFDYSFFLRQGIDLDLYPKIFKETYSRIITKSSTDYNPSIDIDYRSSNTWVYYADCSPADGFWSWKLNPTIATRVPYFAGLFPDLVNQNFIRALQRNSYASQAVKLLTGEVPYLNKDTKASVKDSVAISPELLSHFLQLLKSAIDEAVNVAVAPLNSIRGVEFNGSNDIQSSWTKNTLGTSGVNTNLLYSGGDHRMNTIETMLSSDSDVLSAQEIYPYFEDFLEYQINKRTKNYKFSIKLEGSNIYLDRQRKLDNVMKLAQMGIVLPQSIATAIGKSPITFQRQLDEARVNGWTNNLTPIVSAFQQSANSDDNKGRPEESDDELSESGESTRSLGSNVSKIKANK